MFSTVGILTQFNIINLNGFHLITQKLSEDNKSSKTLCAADSI